MKSRRKARECALQALYQCDTLGDFSDEIINLFFERFCAVEENEAEEDGQYQDFARNLITGVRDNLDAVDEQIASASTHWSIGRMALGAEATTERPSATALADFQKKELSAARIEAAVLERASDSAIRYRALTEDEVKNATGEAA